MSLAPISCWLLLASLILFYPSGIVSPITQLQQARVLLGVASLPLTIPSKRNHLCLLHEALSWARIMFGVNDVHLTFSSTKNYHHLLNGVWNRDVAALKALVAGHSKCPTAFYFLEFGTLMIRHKVMIKRLMYHHHIISRDDNEIIKKVYNKQKDHFTKGDWFQTVKSDF